MKKLYYLGPQGTNSELAAKKFTDLLNIDFELQDISTIPKVASLVDNDENAYGILPLENSIEGLVRPTIDSIISLDVKIQARIDIPIHHSLIAKGKKDKIKFIISHPQALAQCSTYILETYGENITLIQESSTSASIYQLLQKDDTYGAIGISELGKKLNLNIIDENIGDIKDNRTKFVLIAKNKIQIAKDNRTSLIFNTKNKPGALLDILQIFKKNNLNLIYLESRPSKIHIGEYNFITEIDKGIDEVEIALKEVKKASNFCKLLGSYPTVG